MNACWKIGLLTLAGCCTASGIAAVHDAETRRMRKIQELRAAALESRATDKTVRDDASATPRIERATDSDIKSVLISATAPVCDYEATMRCYNHAVALCGGDNDRFSRIAIEIAKERPDRITWAIMELSSRGSIKNLPFLYE